MTLSVTSKTGVALPTRAELRILQVLWEIDQGTVDEVAHRLPSNPPANYKTVQTLLRIMEQKKFVRHIARGRVFVFLPCVTREEVGRLSVRNLLQQNFGGSPAELLINLLQDSRIEESELEELEALIRRYRTQRRTGSSE
jgi:predicted transcriptional regulator